MAQAFRAAMRTGRDFRQSHEVFHPAIGGVPRNGPKPPLIRPFLRIEAEGADKIGDQRVRHRHAAKHDLPALLERAEGDGAAPNVDLRGAQRQRFGNPAPCMDQHKNEGPADRIGS